MVKKTSEPAPPPSAASRFRRWSWLLLLGPLLAVVLSLTLSYLWNEDFFWYLSSGRAILEHGGIPDQDPFLYTSGEGIGWVYHSWLWTVLVAALDRLGGLEAVVIFQALVAVALVVLVYTAARVDRLGLVNALATLLFLLVLRQRLCGKAEIATWLLLVLCFRILERAGPFTWRRGAALGALQVLWANLHGGYPLGVFLALCYSVGGWLEKRRTRRRSGSGTRKGEPALGRYPPLWFPPLLFLLAVADPRMLGERLAPFGFVTGAESVQPVGEAGTMLILEWRSPFAVAGVYPWLPWLFAAAAVTGLASFWVVRRRNLPRLFFFLGMVALGASAVRHLGGFALGAALVTLSNLSQRQPRPRAVPRRKRKKGAAEPAGPAGALGWLNPVACAVVALFLIASAVSLRLARPGFDGGQTESFFTLAPSMVSPGAVGYLLDHEVPGPIFNDYVSGGYLGLRLSPRRQVFIDSRVLDPALVAEYTKMVASAEDWRRAEARYGFRTAVLGNYSKTVRSPLGRTLLRDPRWRLVYIDPLAVIFVRGDGRSFPERQRLRLGDGAAARVPFTDPAGYGPLTGRLQRLFLDNFPANFLIEYLATLGQLGKAEEVRELATEALEAMPGHPMLLRQRCAAHFALGDLPAALEDCSQAYRQRPDDAEIAVLHATVLHRAGRLGEARSVVSRALRREPDHRGLQELRRRLSGAGP